MTGQTVYFMVDCNNFFVSCERVFQPHLKNKPMIVLSNNDGCVISRSQEAKDLGIKMGEPVFKIRSLLKQENVHCCSANFELYSDLSKRIMLLLAQWAEELEIYSIDEAFFTLQHNHPSSLSKWAHDLANCIERWVGVPVTIGIGATKTLAKLASEMGKKKQQAVYNIWDQPDTKHLLEQFPIQDVWGIGHRWTRKLEHYGIRNALDLIHMKDDWVLKHFNITLLKTVQELRGTICFGLNEHGNMAKSIGVSRSFGHLISDESQLFEAMSTFVRKASQQLRRQKLRTQRIQVYIRTNKHRMNHPQYANSIELTLPMATQCTHQLLAYAQKGLRAIYQPGFEYYKVGVILLNLSPNETVQQTLFQTIDSDQRQEQLMLTMDHLNQTLGDGIIRYACEGNALSRSKWQSKSQHCSRRYTSRWNELAEVRVS